RIDLRQGLVIDAEAVLDVGSVVFDQDVRFFDHLDQDVAALVRLQFEADAALVRVKVLEVVLVTGARAIVLGVGRLDFDHFGPHLAQLTNTGRARAGSGQVDDLDMRQGHWSVFRLSNPRLRSYDAAAADAVN